MNLINLRKFSSRQMWYDKWNVRHNFIYGKHKYSWEFLKYGCGGMGNCLHMLHLQRLI